MAYEKALWKVMACFFGPFLSGRRKKNDPDI